MAAVRRILSIPAIFAWWIGLALPAVALAEVPPEVVAAQQRRADAIERASQATVAVFDASGGGGGSGVLISADGFALTNYHVVQPCGAAMKCGLPDGRLYDAVIVSIDPVGDVAMIQLLGRDDFPVATWGDSDRVEVGDWCFAAGNPFLLADDFRPTISYGIISGVHRYQYPAGTLLEYTDCLQTDAAINPGNSGGPLFDAEGRLIGINGRGSFEKRGRVNVGVGYAISINQIERFLGHLKSGRILDHASLGATVTTVDGTAIVDEVLEFSDFFRRGIRYNDAIVKFAGREIANANALKNVLGVFPPGWRVPIAYRRDGVTASVQVRLMGLHGEAELIDLVQQQPPAEEPPPGRPQPPGDLPSEPEQDPTPRRPQSRPQSGGEPELPEAVAARYEPRRGFANYWYNTQNQQRVWTRYVELGDLHDVGYHWKIDGALLGISAKEDRFTIETTPRQATMTMPLGTTGAVFTGELFDQLSPPRSGGFLLALHMWQRMLDKGLRQFGEVYYLGHLPVGPEQVVCDCLVGIADAVELRMFFDRDSGDLTALELFPRDDMDPCEVVLDDYRELGTLRLPYRWRIYQGENLYAELRVENWELTATPPSGRPNR